MKRFEAVGVVRLWSPRGGSNGRTDAAAAQATTRVTIASLKSTPAYQEITTVQKILFAKPSGMGTPTHVGPMRATTVLGQTAPSLAH